MTIVYCFKMLVNVLGNARVKQNGGSRSISRDNGRPEIMLNNVHIKQTIVVLTYPYHTAIVSR
jgi:hypothetical protein